jgi:hypothetical protein
MVTYGTKALAGLLAGCNEATVTVWQLTSGNM